MSLNKNNFLRWTGSWTADSYTIVSGYPLYNSSTMHINEDVTIVSNVFLFATASNGIDKYSFRIIQCIDVSTGDPVIFNEECSYDPTTGNLTVFRPQGTHTSINFTCTFQDSLGNYPPHTFNVVIFFDSIFVSWSAYPPSATCVLDTFGNNNGYLQWSQLQKINTGTSLPLSPLQLKPNNPADPDYIAPLTDLTTCPLQYGTGQYAPLTISNFSQNSADSNPNNYIVITQFQLACSACGSGGTPLLYTQTCNIAPGQSQRFNVPAINWDTGLTITYFVQTGGNMATASPLREWFSNVNGVKAGYPASSTVIDNSGTFGNNTINVGYPNGITIFAQ